ncbi:MAG: FecR domain-containing protein [Bacteroidales bacterium]|nr:FecR domain-containing protein [Bacteroidales bacterium]
MTDQINKLLIKKIQGRCTPEEELQLQGWLFESEENRNIFFQYKMFWQAQKIKTYSSESHLNVALEKYNKRIDTIRSKEKRIKIFKGLRWAAIVLVIACLPTLYFYLKTDKHEVTLITESVGLKGDIKVINLTDGTKVWLNKGSSVRYPSKFENIERTIYLEGEVFLDVKKDPTHPFIVKTQSIQIKVLGTSFNINTRCEDNIVQTTLVEGSVMILDENGKKIASLNPGQMAAVDISSKKVQIKDVNPKCYTSWRTGEVYFENANLVEIITKIEEVYGIKIQFDTYLSPKNVNQKRYNFIFHRGQPVDTVFEMLNFIAPCKFVKKDNKQNPKNPSK